jgi:hypothetical protein
MRSIKNIYPSHLYRTEYGATGSSNMWKSWKIPAAAAVALLAYPTWHWLQLGDYLDFGLDCLGLGVAGLSFVRVLAAPKPAQALPEPVQTGLEKPASQPAAVEKPAAVKEPDADPEAALYARCIEAQEQFGIRYVHTDGFECAVIKRVSARLRQEGWDVQGECGDNPIPGYEDLSILELRRQEAEAAEPADAAQATAAQPAANPPPPALVEPAVVAAEAPAQTK